MLGLGFWVIVKIFGNAFWHPNAYPLAGTLDAWKNYFTPAWYIKYDSGISFTGMNFPYGEHVLFTDNQPLISWVLQWVHTHIIPIADQTVGILNMLIFLNIYLCMFLLYRIARHFSLPHLYAIPLAIILALLSPQIHRFAGHYALAYTAYIPLIWWLLIQTSGAKRKWLPFSALVLAVSLSGFVHAYYLLMGVLFAFCYFGIRAWMYHKQQNMRADLIKAGIALIIPVLVIQTFLWLTDTINDRPDNPSGILFYKAYWNSVFLPVQGPMWDAWQRFFIYERATVEGFSYVGLTAFWVFVMSLIRIIRYAWHQKFARIWRPVLPDDLAVTVWASVLLLLFAMAIPLSWGLEFLLDIFPPIKQFRSLGRFAWVFYYVFTMYSAVYLYLIYRRLRQRQMQAFGLGILVVAMVMWGWEAAIHIKLHAEVIKRNRDHNVFIHDYPPYEQWLAEHNYSISDFQAILPIPVFNTGSEKFVPRWVTSGITEQVYMLAYKTGLPLACGSMSRTSVSQSSKLVQLLSSDYLQKEILNDYPNLQSPLLILKEEDVPLSVNEQEILNKAKLIKREGRYSLHELNLSTLKSKSQKILKLFEEQKDSTLIKRDDFYLSEDKWIHWNGFEKRSQSAFGEETISGNKEDILILFEDVIPDTSWMQMSVWMKIDHHVSGFPVFNYKEFDKNDVQIFHAEEGTMFGMNVYKNWLLVEYRFKLKEVGNKAVIYMQHRYPEMESLLIRPENVDVYKTISGEHQLMYNNYYFD